MLVQTTYGTLRGQTAENGVESFLGIPYALPPVGALRFERPQPPLPWLGVRGAACAGGECIQDEAPELTDAGSREYKRGQFKSEDCLYLNLWRPARAEAGLPVLVFVHGGGFVSGAGGRAIYSGAKLAAGGMIVVTINYRLSVFGFFDASLLRGQNAPDGNQGLWDQLAALQWVHENIRAFGGDPDRVTLAGQSAGGMSALALASCSFARGLFRRVIIQSGGGFPPILPFEPAESARRTALEFAGGRTLDELRQIDSITLYRQSRAFRWQPSVDTLLLSDDWAAKLSQRPDAPDLLIGSTAHEWSGNFGKEQISAENAAWVRRTADEIAASCIRLARCLRRKGANCFLYRFAFPIDHPDAAFYGAPHGSELPFVFGYENHGSVCPWTVRKWRDEDYILSDALTRYWTNFVATGNPNGARLPEWPRFCAEEALLWMGAKENAVCFEKRAATCE